MVKSSIYPKEVESPDLWKHLIFGSYSPFEIAQAVKDPYWQHLRQMMKGTMLKGKREILEIYLQDEDHSYESRIRVTNYVNALKRGGFVK